VCAVGVTARLLVFTLATTQILFIKLASLKIAGFIFFSFSSPDGLFVRISPLPGKRE
jgi:hypothetical protein